MIKPTLRTQLKNLNEIVLVNTHIRTCLLLHNIVMLCKDEWLAEEPPEDINPPMDAQNVSANGRALRSRIKRINLDNE